MQNPLFAGLGSVAAYLPAQKIAIAVATTFGENSFAAHGSNPSERASHAIFARIGAELAPDFPPHNRG